MFSSDLHTLIYASLPSFAHTHSVSENSVENLLSTIHSLPGSMLGILRILITVPVLVKKLEPVGRSENSNWECSEDQRRRKTLSMQGTGNISLGEMTLKST